MKLKMWIKKNKMRQVDVANHLGITYRALYNYKNGKRPRLEIAQRIVALTEGQVSYGDLAK